jgi:site-specific DNA-methyltransferase (adenine-specific)
MPEYSLFLGDCLDILPTLEDGSVDAILTDVPYGTTACKWDVIIPLEPMWKEVKRVLKKHGVFVTTASQPFTSVLVSSNIEWFKYEWIWKKNKVGAVSHAKNAPLKLHENVAVFSAGSISHVGNENRMNYYPRGLVQVNKAVRQKLGRDFTSKGHRPSDKPVYTQEFTNYPKSVLDVESVNKTVHPTQKPVALYEYLVKTYTNEGDTVLDFCMGSGTTGVAALKLGRKFVGIEKDPKYFAVAAQRIQDSIEEKELENG